MGPQLRRSCFSISCVHSGLPRILLCLYLCRLRCQNLIAQFLELFQPVFRNRSNGGVSRFADEDIDLCGSQANYIDKLSRQSHQISARRIDVTQLTAWQ